MKTIILLISVVFLVFTTSHAQAQKENKKKTEAVKISASMHCQACADNIITNMGFEPGVKKVTADHTINLVVIEYYPKRTNPDKLVAKIMELGYNAERIIE
jgi:periplasmic mercuric ion binding protein